MLVDWPRFKLGGLNLQGLDHPAGPGLSYLSVHDMVWDEGLSFPKLPYSY